MIAELRAASSNAADLETFLEANIQALHDYFSYRNFENLATQKRTLRGYILLNLNTFRNLPVTNDHNLGFLTLLLDTCERFGFSQSFNQIYQILKQQEFDFGDRLEAAALYMIGIRDSSDYLKRFDELIEKLKESEETAEDNDLKVTATLVNFYAQIVHNYGEFNNSFVETIRQKIIEKQVLYSNSFLAHEIITTVLNFPTVPHTTAFDAIQNSLNELLSVVDIEYEELAEDFLIETDTIYANNLGQVANNFAAIRAYAASLRPTEQPVRDAIFKTLRRGVAVLTEAPQLLTYLFSYGKMHYRKLTEAFRVLPPTFFENNITLTDWGCGQGLASMVYLEFLNNRGYHQNIRRITLIEPSQIALKRAALHVKKFGNEIPIRTIRKDLDSLLDQDCRCSYRGTVHFHIFSNILEMEVFSLMHLLNLINRNYKGENYFICVSPYISDQKRNRIDAFVNFFTNMEQFELINATNNKRGEWINSWSRIQRIFKVTLN